MLYILEFTHRNKIPCGPMPGLLYSCLKNTGKNKLSFSYQKFIIDVIKPCPKSNRISILLGIVTIHSKCYIRFINNAYGRLKLHYLRIKSRLNILNNSGQLNLYAYVNIKIKFFSQNITSIHN